jgi:hypothetical protein
MPAPAHDYDALPTDRQAPSFRQELRVIGVVLAFVALLEIIARFIAPRLDQDRRHIHALPETIAELETRAAASGHPRVVFFGNSLILRGLDEPTFHAELQQLGGPQLATTKITPVGTAMLDWLYLYQRYCNRAESHPDILVVGFVAHHLHDQEPVKIRRLARHFVAARDFPTLWRTDLETFHERVQSVLCGLSALGGDQPEHQMYLLDRLVPAYQAGLKENHRLVQTAAARQARQAAEVDPAPPAEAGGETFERMARFIDLCQARGVKIWFVAMPQPEPWTVHPAAIRLARERGMNFLDAQTIEGITAADFSDGYHLGETGADKFSRWLAAAFHDPERR